MQPRIISKKNQNVMNEEIKWRNLTEWGDDRGRRRRRRKEEDESVGVVLRLRLRLRPRAGKRGPWRCPWPGVSFVGVKAREDDDENRPSLFV